MPQAIEPVVVTPAVSLDGTTLETIPVIGANTYNGALGPLDPLVLWSGAQATSAGRKIGGVLDEYPGSREAILAAGIGITYATGGQDAIAMGAAMALGQNQISDAAQDHFQDVGYGNQDAYMGGAGVNVLMSVAMGGWGLASVGAKFAAGASRVGLLADGAEAESGVAKYIYDSSVNRFRSTETGQFVAARDLPYPADAGFASSIIENVPVGKILDRYGEASGRFLGEPGATVSERGLAPGSEGMPYSQYRVVQPFEARVGPAAAVPEFGATGGATQYLPRQTVQQLIDSGYIVKVP